MQETLWASIIVPCVPSSGLLRQHRIRDIHEVMIMAFQNSVYFNHGRWRSRHRNPHLRRALLTAAGLTAGCSGMSGTEAGSDEQAIQGGQIETGFPAVGEVATSAGFCSGTLISPSFVLTAGHCAGSSMVFKTGTRPSDFVSHTVDQQITHPSKDLLLAHLATPIYDIAPLPLNPGPVPGGPLPGVGAVCSGV